MSGKELLYLELIYVLTPRAVINVQHFVLSKEIKVINLPETSRQCARQNN